jgi:ABC-type cobalamin transport system ATPase subunit
MRLAKRSAAVVFVLVIATVVATFPASAHAQQPATVTFTLNFPGSEPDHYVIAVSDDGHATYTSGGKLSPDAEASEDFHLEFTVSAGTRSRIFDLAKRTHYFEGKIDSGKKNIAATGMKTLAYKDAYKSSETSYNYSMNRAVQQLTEVFQDLSATLEFGRRLEFYHQYQKLALDAELKRMEEMAKGGNLEDLSVISGILQQIANDQSVINVDRARAQRLLALARTSS